MKILVCDDDPLMRHIISKILNTGGHQVELTWGGHEALEIIQANPNSFHVLITDNNMPRMTGIELIEKIRALGVRMKMIMTIGNSAHLDTEVQERLRLDGILSKLFTKNELLDCVNALVC